MRKLGNVGRGEGLTIVERRNREGQNDPTSLRDVGHPADGAPRSRDVGTRDLGLEMGLRIQAI